MKKIFIIITLMFMLLPTLSHAEASVSGLVSFVGKNSGYQDYTNLTFKSFSNFHSTRARIFFDAAASENLDVFTQILIDGHNYDLYAAYMRLSSIGGSSFSLNLGLIPNPVGSWGPRTYNDANPLIGVPLAYNMHSSYIPGGSTQVYTINDILPLRTNRSNFGLPNIYDACWNSGAELYYTKGKLFWSVGLISGAVSRPTIDQSKDIPQVTTHFTYMLSPRLTLGASAFAGPYLFDGAYNDTLPTGKDPEDFMNVGIGYELHYEGCFIDIYSEMFHTYWEHPYLDKLQLTVGYIEGKYKFTPGWYLAGRFDFYQPNSLTDSNGNNHNWDYPIRRVEAGIGYHPNRAMTVKLVTQINNYLQTEQLDEEIYALQVVAGF